VLRTTARSPGSRGAQGRRPRGAAGRPSPRSGRASRDDLARAPARKPASIRRRSRPDGRDRAALLPEGCAPRRPLGPRDRRAGREHLPRGSTAAARWWATRPRRRSRRHKRIIDLVDERHRISLVGFALSSRVVVGQRAGDTVRSRRDSRRRSIACAKMLGGGTFLGGGIRTGTDLVQRFAADARILLVLSDGRGPTTRPKRSPQGAARPRGPRESSCSRSGSAMTTRPTNPAQAGDARRAARCS